MTTDLKEPPPTALAARCDACEHIFDPVHLQIVSTGSVCVNCLEEGTEKVTALHTLSRAAAVALPLAWAWAWIGFVVWAVSIAGTPDASSTSFRFSSYGGGGSELGSAMWAIYLAAAGAIGAIVFGARLFRDARVRPPWPVLPQAARRTSRIAGATAIALGVASMGGVYWAFTLLL